MKKAKQTCGQRLKKRQVKQLYRKPENASYSLSHDYWFDSAHINLCDLVKLLLDSLENKNNAQ